MIKIYIHTTNVIHFLKKARGNLNIFKKYLMVLAQYYTKIKN